MLNLLPRQNGQISISHYLFFSWILGALGFLVLAPPFFAPDETFHATWAARFLTNKDPHQGTGCSELEKSLLTVPFESLIRDQQVNPIPRNFSGSTAEIPDEACQKIHPAGNYVYPAFYAPYIFSNLVWKNPTGAYFLSRFLQFLIFGFGLYWLLKRLSHQAFYDKSHWVLFFWFCLPLSIQQITSITSDFWVYLGTLALIFLTVAPKISKIETLFCFCLFAFGAMVKPVILPLAWIPFVSRSRLASESPRNTLFYSGIFICHVFIIYRGVNFLFGFNTGTTHDVTGAGSSQLKFVIENPLTAFGYIFSSSWYKGLQYPGARLGWLSFKPTVFEVLLAHVPLVIYLSVHLKNLFQANDRAKNLLPQIRSLSLKSVAPIFWFLVLGTAYVSLTGLSLFIGYSRPGDTAVHGLQARYFFPLLVCTFAFFNSFLVYKNFGVSRNQKIALVVSIFSLILISLTRINLKHPFV